MCRVVCTTALSVHQPINCQSVAVCLYTFPLLRLSRNHETRVTRLRDRLPPGCTSSQPCPGVDLPRCTHARVYTCHQWESPSCVERCLVGEYRGQYGVVCLVMSCKGTTAWIPYGILGYKYGIHYTTIWYSLHNYMVFTKQLYGIHYTSIWYLLHNYMV